MNVVSSLMGDLERLSSIWRMWIGSMQVLCLAFGYCSNFWNEFSMSIVEWLYIIFYTLSCILEVLFTFREQSNLLLVNETYQPVFKTISSQLEIRCFQTEKIMHNAHSFLMSLYLIHCSFLSCVCWGLCICVCVCTWMFRCSSTQALVWIV